MDGGYLVMAKHNIGPKNGMWKGGRTVTKDGYVLILVGKDHHLADVRGYAYEHRLVAEKKIGRRLRPGEQVHHEDDNRLNNETNNLMVKKSFAEHRFVHRKKGSNLQLLDEPNNIVECACGCGAQFHRFDYLRRPRRFVSGHKLGSVHG